MNYPFLQYGDRLPCVAVLQKLLNGYGGYKLKLDGYFGPKTWKAVAAVQKYQGFRESGQVNHGTWQFLATGRDLEIVDVVDVFDDALVTLEVKDIQKVGGTLIKAPGSSNSIASAVSDILSIAWDTFLIRFHGHGAPGSAGLGTGDGGLDGGLSGNDFSLTRPVKVPEDPSYQYSLIQPSLQKLAGVFGPYGCVQLMHCQTGRGKDGWELLDKMADDLGVPVTAGINDQLGGGLDTFRFEGPTRTSFPYRLSLQQWANELPDF